ncbi:hypothetical protein ANN_15918 [Periplaneta americana]|uniref:Uncharacterized protein n=1 Tax=Periplaneta americana TaxID=6978 RepID=A0ABQ8SHS4_PERAM|nr:hypothetical protein ANN_15918 [Periplaneta americana]
MIRGRATRFTEGLVEIKLVLFRSSEWDEGDNASEMSPGSSTESYLPFAHIGLRENPRNNLNLVTCPDRESNPGHQVSCLDELTVTPQRNPVAKASYNGWGDHRATHTIPPFWLDDRPPLLRHVGVRPAAGWSV